MLAWSFAIKDANNSELMYTKSLKSMLYGITVRVVLAFVLSLAASIFSYAQECNVRVYYPYDDATLMRDYMDNANAFAEIAEIIASNSEVVPCFEIISYSSPEGDWNYNLQLSRRRAKSLKRYLERKYPELVGNITINPNAEAWEELHNLVSRDRRLSESSRAEILRIVDSDKAPDAKERELRDMEGYKKFYRHFFRSLRYAQISVVGETPKVAASGTDGVECADAIVATDSTSTVISDVSEKLEESVYNTETAEHASNDTTAVSGSAATASDSTSVASSGSASHSGSTSSTSSSTSSGASAVSSSNNAGEPTVASVAGVPVVYFRYNEDFIRPDFKHNAENLQEIVRMIQAGEITDFTIAGFSSPEGSVRTNVSLSLRRAKTLKRYLVNLFPELENKITIVNGGENWSGLREQVENGTALTDSEKAEILNIINSDANPETKEARLHSTTSYRRIMHKYLPNIRCASFVTDIAGRTGQTVAEPQGDNVPDDPATHQLDTVSTQIDTTGAIGSQVVTPADTTVTPVDTTGAIGSQVVTPVDTTAVQTDTLEHNTTPEPQRYPLFAVSTNLLYDAVAAPNIAIEVPIGQKWSVYGEYTFPWWLPASNEWCYEMLKWDIGARYRLGNNFDKNDPMDILSGHFVGVDLSAGYYDFEPLHKGYQGEFQMASLEYGYAWKLGDNWRLDAVIGAGWLGTHYRYYEADPTDQHLIYKYSGKLNWMGPTKLGVSIKYIFTTSRRGER